MPSGSLDAARAAAIYVDDLAGDETGALGTQKQDRGGDLWGCPDAAKRDARNSAAVELIRRNAARARGRVTQSSPAWRVDGPRIDPGHQNIVLGAFFGQRLGEVQQAGIDRAAGKIHRPWLVPRPSDDVDDPSPLLGPHGRQHELG